MTSHLWLFSQALGTLFHIVAAFGPLFLYLIDPGSPVRRTVLSVCCANLLIFILRTVLTFIIMHSILDARNGGAAAAAGGRKMKRGLSRESLLRLRRVDSSAESAVGGPGMCSICLAQFEPGESLVLLPCDERHSFHEECITQWLVKSAQCPLCMGEVSVPRTPPEAVGAGAEKTAATTASAAAGAAMSRRAAAAVSASS